MRKVAAYVIGVTMILAALVSTGAPASAARRCRWWFCTTTTTTQPTTTTTQATTTTLSTTTTTATTTTTTAPTTTTTLPQTDIAKKLLGMKLINYYPSDAGWTLMWTKFPIDEMNADFAKMHAMGANSVRIILQVSTIGYPNPTAAMMDKFHQVIAAAWANGLQTQVTLFDWFGGWTEISNSTHWAQVVLAGLASDPRISFVEIKNEIIPSDATQMTWAKTMLPVVRGLIGNLPLTISIRGDATQADFQAIHDQLGSMIDFYDAHDYGSATARLATYQQIAAPKPLYVGEAGHSTGAGGTDCSADTAGQVSFFNQVNAKTASLGIALSAPWSWQDFTYPMSTISGSTSSEYCYGLLHVDGSEKPAMTVERTAFQG